MVRKLLRTVVHWKWCRLASRGQWQALWFASGGEKEPLAFEDQVCIPNSRIRLRDACPQGSVAEASLRDLSERISLAHGDFCGRPERRDGCGHVNLRASYDAIAVNDIRIDGQQIAPAEPSAQIVLRNLP